MKSFNEIYNMNEIEEFHLQRMDKHISKVKKYLLEFTNSDLSKELNFSKRDAIELGNKHDQDKIEGDLFEQYKYISWLYKCKLAEVPCDIPYTEDMDKATTAHIRNNKHHPEYWDPNFTPQVVTDFNQRDSTKLKSRDGRKMPVAHIIEMCCDWKATSEERGNKAVDWAYKCLRDKRYIFTDNQWDLIYRILGIID